MQLSVVSLLVALTSGESLCGALRELFEVPVSVVGSGVAVCVRYMLVHICGAFHNPQSVRLGTGQMRCWRED